MLRTDRRKLLCQRYLLHLVLWEVRRKVWWRRGRVALYCLCDPCAQFGEFGDHLAGYAEQKVAELRADAVAGLLQPLNLWLELRQQAIVRVIQALIAQKGEDAVLFDHTEAE